MPHINMLARARPDLRGVQGIQPGRVFKCYGPQTKNLV